MTLALALLSFVFPPGQYWVEGGERAWLEDAKLHMQADNPAVPGGGAQTVWSKSPHPANFRLNVNAHVVSSSVNANNINLFFSYTDPTGKPLYDSRDSRKDANYGHYHKIPGYIITFVNDKGTARVRIRRNPGFRLLAEIFSGESRQGVTYRLTVEKRGGEIRFLIDGKERLRATDADPLGGGLLGLRTFRTHLWWSDLKLESLP
jgi:hypothetical protein